MNRDSNLQAVTAVQKLFHKGFVPGQAAGEVETGEDVDAGECHGHVAGSAFQTILQKYQLTQLLPSFWSLLARKEQMRYIFWVKDAYWILTINKVAHELPIHRIFASLRQSNPNELQHASQSPLHSTNPWPDLHEDNLHPVPNPYDGSFYPPPPPLLQYQSYLPASSYCSPIPDPLLEAPAVNWVQAFFDELASDPQASLSDQKAGPSVSAQSGSSQNADILLIFTFDDETAFTSLSTTRMSSHPVRHAKPYDRTCPLRGTRSCNPDQGEGDVVEDMYRCIFDCALMPKPEDVVEMARKSLRPGPTLESSTEKAQWYMTAEGQAGVVKILGVLTTLRDDIKSLARAWVVIEYQIPLYMQTLPVIKLFVGGLIKDYNYIKRPINISFGVSFASHF
ncbi:hypothetical protein BDR05DRAFT_951139 [Suillus weaverae]|nr:hypothetical protein BDR05DRAFT_951139 [Suillus weaverae]